jgi:hypothetical protein
LSGDPHKSIGLTFRPIAVELQAYDLDIGPGWRDESSGSNGAFPIPTPPSVEEFQQRVEERANEVDLSMDDIDRLVHDAQDSDE